MNKDLVLQELTKKGFFRITDFHTIEDYEKLTDSLGEIVHSSDIRVMPEDQQFSVIKTAESIPMHHDSPEADFISWYCISEAESYEPTLLLDGNKLIGQLTENEKKALSLISSNLTMDGTCPVLSENRLSYDPQLLLLDGASEECLHALTRLNTLIESSKSELIEVHLKQHEILIIDNARMMHGRGNLRQNSSRYLYRRWIKKV
jgi:hypothetical protein